MKLRRLYENVAGSLDKTPSRSLAAKAKLLDTLNKSPETAAFLFKIKYRQFESNPSKLIYLDECVDYLNRALSGADETSDFYRRLDFMRSVAFDKIYSNLKLTLKSGMSGYFARKIAEIYQRQARTEEEKVKALAALGTLNYNEYRNSRGRKSEKLQRAKELLSEATNLAGSDMNLLKATSYLKGCLDGSVPWIDFKEYVSQRVGGLNGKPKEHLNGFGTNNGLVDIDEYRRYVEGLIHQERITPDMITAVKRLLTLEPEKSTTGRVFSAFILIRYYDQTGNTDALKAAKKYIDQAYNLAGDAEREQNIMPHKTYIDSCYSRYIG